MFIFLKRFLNAINSAYRACAERVHALIKSWLGPEENDHIEAVASSKAAAVKINVKKETFHRELRKKMDMVSTHHQAGQQDGIVLNEPAMKALKNDIKFIQSDSIQTTLSEAWMQADSETVKAVVVESMGVLTINAQLMERVK
uniref:AlNc14C269G9937 protein n=1 Tax=Albugo laibachii Nc14 TaxID=890382 RepID=F0WUB6_9STRA|nr:AlNc14C269G9937 [Albugo laibachii Nc14]|eukprot:CCA24994.1 AlNc14C269G9937 [Albugo laibachii Nc14]